MRFNEKPISFSIDDILKSSNQSIHYSFPIMTSTSRLETLSDQRLSSCQCHLSALQLDTMDPNFIHHRRCRRTRTVFSDAQLNGLEKRFETQKYLSTFDRNELADMLNLSQLQIKTWYQNRRMKWKKQVLQEGYKEVPTKSKGRPKKNSIPSYAELQRLENEKQQNSSSYPSDGGSTSYSDNDEEELIDIEQ